MHILVFGSKGWIGSQFISLLHKNNISFIGATSRADNIEDIEKEIEYSKPTHVISFIGRTHGTINDTHYSTIDYLEQEGKLQENIRDNLFAPLVLGEICRKKNIHFTYLGTGCIFKYDKDHPNPNGFNEDSKPNFFGSSYSIVKGFTDQYMKLLESHVLNLRIRMPIVGEKHPRNFITKITSYEKICSIPNSMTVLPDVLPCVLEMLKKRMTGTINLTNPGVISHNEILDLYTKIVDPSFRYKNFSQEEQRKILASDRSNNYLCTNKLESLFPDIKPIKDSIEQILYQYKDSLSSKKRLLVTGGYGFIGSNFINTYIENESCEYIVNIDAMYYCAKESNVKESIRSCSEKYTFIKDNLSSYKYIYEILEKYNITHVIHFAAQSHVQNSFSDSLQYTKDNIVGTHNMLEGARLYGRLQRFIHVSTDEVYGESMNDVDESKKTEQSILCPTNPYAATKAGAELLAQSYHHSFRLPIIISRGNNVYGPNQYPEKLIPKFIQLLKENKPVTIQGDGSAVRGFLHVNDTVSAFEKIVEHGVIGEIYNIGCDEYMEYSVMDVATLLIQYIHNTTDYNKWITYIEDRPYNDKRYYISNEKVKALGWKIEIPFEEGIKSIL